MSDGDVTGMLEKITRVFCAHCRKAQRSTSRLCPDCGETLLEQGYCDVCEQCLLLRVGESCPKHDVPLQSLPSQPFNALFQEAASNIWVTILRVHHPTVAIAPRLKLEAEGIPTFLEGERMGPETGLFGEGLRLQVPRMHSAQALKVLAEVHPYSEISRSEHEASFEKTETGQSRLSRLFILAGFAMVAWLLLQGFLVLLRVH